MKDNIIITLDPTATLITGLFLLLIVLSCLVALLMERTIFSYKNNRKGVFILSIITIILQFIAILLVALVIKV